MDAFIVACLERLAATSVQTVVLVTLVWGLCRLLPRVPPATQCWLWWLVALQALLGLVAPPLELPWLAQAPAVPVVETMPLAAAGGDAMAGANTAAPAVPPGFPWQLGLVALWLAGVIVMSGVTLRDWWRSRELLRRSAPCTDEVLVEALTLAAEAHGLRRTPRLRVSDGIDSPQLVGPWRPILLLPAHRLLGGDDLDMALTHELVHLHRRDLWWGWGPTLARHLFFFHPLIHLAVREYGIAREAACDAAVVAGDRRCRHDYGRLLVRLGTSPSLRTGLASASPTFLCLKRRLTMLQNTASFPRVGAFALLILVAAIGVAPLRLVAAPSEGAATAGPQSAGGGTVIVQSTTSLVSTASGEDEVSGQLHLSKSGTDQAYVRIRGKGERTVMNGSTDDLEEARRAIAGQGDALWVRQGGARYLIRDPETLARFDALIAPIRELGDQQGALGQRQGALGQQQGKLGQEQGELGQRQARLALAAAQRAMDGGSRDESASEKREQAELAARQKALGERQEGLSRRQADLSQQQAVLSTRQAEASQRANEGLKHLLATAFASGVAQPIGK